MKTLFAIIILAITASANAAETKQVCTPIKNQVGHAVLNKDGTTKQTCRTIKIHKKYDGTAVPTKAPAKTSINPYGFDPAVQKRQKELIAAGAKITADGVTGPATRRAEAEFGNLVPKK
jgi:peptidoglycan hydrolase-like protein with peptidoglycan-binding domain